MKRIFTAVFMILMIAGFTTCTVVLSDSLEGADAGEGGILDPMLDIMEEELTTSYDDSSVVENLGGNGTSAGRSVSRALAGSANSILHVLPVAAVTQVKDRVDDTVRNLGLGRSRDISKVAPAVAEATVDALLDETLVGTELTDEELVDIHSVSTRAVVKAMNSASVTNIAEGLGTPEERTTQLEALLEQTSDSLDEFGFSAENTADALQKIVLVVSETGNDDLTDPADADEVDAFTARMNMVLSLTSEKMDNPALFTGTDCSDALNALANAAVFGLGGTAFSTAGAADLQEVVRDGILTGLFYAFYGFQQDVSLSSADLQAALTFDEALNALDALEDTAADAFFTSVSTNIQAVKDTTLIPEAVSTARESYIISSPDDIPDVILEEAEVATSVTSGTTTWSAGSAVRVSSNITISGTLNIEPGVIVYLDIDRNITVNSTGNIQAIGTLADPIIFTRATSSGAWGSISVASGGNNFDYCDISGGTDGLIITGRADVSNCLVHDNSSNGIDGDASTEDLGVITTVRDCYFYGNGSWPVLINQYMDLDSSNHFYDPAGETQAPDLTTPYNGINFAGNIDNHVIFDVTEVPYYYAYNINIRYINSPGSLTVSPGVVVKFGTDNYLIRINSMITALGTAENPIVFTSYTNSDVGGDTNGSGTSGSPGDWVGLDIIGAGSDFEYCEFSYADKALDFNQGTDDQGQATFDNCKFHDNASYAIEASEARAGSTVSNSYFWDNVSWPVNMNQHLVLDGTNHFYNPDIDTEPDLAVPYNAIRFVGDINTEVSFAETEIPYYYAYDINTRYISVPGSLTVAPGAIVKFGTDNYLIRVNSMITALGTAENPIVFTSYTNSDVGGDTNGSGTAGTPGDWAGLDIIGAGSLFSYCEFSYADKALDFNQGTDDQGQATFDNCKFHNNSTYGIEGSEARVGTTVSNSYFWDHVSWPVNMNQHLALDGTNHFYNPDTDTEPDLTIPYNAIRFVGDIDTAVTFAETDIPYYYAYDINTRYINVPGSLTISPGVIVKFGTDNNRIRVNSKITAAGTAENPIIFTSYTNSDLGGDTDGQTTPGSPGDWQGLSLRGANSEFTYCTFTYAVTPMDFADSGTVEIDYCTIQNNSSGGVDARNALAGTVISNSNITGNNATVSGPYDINVAGNGNVTFDDNNVTDFINP